MVDKESVSNNIIQLYAFVEQSFNKQRNRVKLQTEKHDSYLSSCFSPSFFFSDP